MENFKEIAEKCLSGELSGTFVCKLQSRGKFNIHSKNLSKCKDGYILNYPDPCTFDYYDNNGISTPFGYNQVINFIPDMKENDKRNVQISLQQAREWYNGNNDILKTLALSSFSKQELDPYPRSWNEYVKSHPGLVYMITTPDSICKSLSAYGALLLLCQEWIHIWSQEQGLKKDWEPNWNDRKAKWIIMLKSENLGGIVVDNRVEWSSPIVFPTEDLAINFLNTFKSLLEKAKGLY